MPTALVVEENREALIALTEVIEREGFTTSTARTFDDARAELRRMRADVVLIDMSLQDCSALDILLEIPAIERPQVVLMSEDESVRAALEGMALCAVHVVQKPVEADALTTLLRAVRRECRAKAADRRASTRQLIGDSPQMEHLRALVAKVAPTGVSVYVEGESGTGKELVAEAIHAASNRADGPFVAVNCGAIPDSLVDSELFGHTKGAFTGATGAKPGVFEQAGGGTLFLDEITEMPAELQVRLLRVLETGRLRRVGGTSDIEIDVRIVAASNRAAERALAEQRIRKDLFHRLSVFPILVPPLRNRTEDIPALARHFVDEIGAEEGHAKELDRDVLELLQGYPWPGNVRQLRNAIQRAYIVAGAMITPAALPAHVREWSGAAETPEVGDHGNLEVPVGTTIAEAEKALIEATLEDCEGDKPAAAESLGISLRTLYNRLKQYAEEREAERGDAC